MSVLALLGVSFMVVVGGGTMVVGLYQLAKSGLRYAQELTTLDIGDDLGVVHLRWRAEKYDMAEKLWLAMLPGLLRAYATTLIVRGLVDSRAEVRQLLDGITFVVVADPWPDELRGGFTAGEWLGYRYSGKRWAQCVALNVDGTWPDSLVVHECEHGRDHIIRGIDAKTYKALGTHFADVAETRDVIKASVELWKESAT